MSGEGHSFVLIADWVFTTPEPSTGCAACKAHREHLNPDPCVCTKTCILECPKCGRGCKCGWKRKKRFTRKLGDPKDNPRVRNLDDAFGIVWNGTPRGDKSKDIYYKRKFGVNEDGDPKTPLIEIVVHSAKKRRTGNPITLFR